MTGNRRKWIELRIYVKKTEEGIREMGIKEAHDKGKHLKLGNEIEDPQNIS